MVTTLTGSFAKVSQLHSMATPPAADPAAQNLRNLLNAYDKKKASLPKEIAKPSIVMMCMDTEATCEHCGAKGTLGDKCEVCRSGYRTRVIPKDAPLQASPKIGNP